MLGAEEIYLRDVELNTKDIVQNVQWRNQKPIAQQPESTGVCQHPIDA